MLAAIILEVMDKSESDSLKVYKKIKILQIKVIAYHNINKHLNYL